MKPPFTSVHGEAPPATSRLALVCLSLTMLLPSLGTSIANIALPTLAEAFSAPFQYIQWIVLAYLLTITISIVSVGRLGDLFGRRPVLLTGILVFMVGSALCAIAPSFNLLLIGRAVQGLGAAAMMTLSMALVSEAVPKNKTGSAMGLLATMSAFGTALGPSLGGVLIARYGWQAIFLVNLPIGLLTLLLAERSLPRPNIAAARVKFDHLGTIVLALTLTSYSFAMTTGKNKPGLLNILLLIAALLGAVWFTRVEARAVSPLIRIDALRAPRLRGSFAMSALVASVVMATLVVGPFYLSRAMGLSAASVGALMSTGPFVAALVGIPAGRLVDRFGSHRMTTLGLYVMVLGTLGLALPGMEMGSWTYVLPLVLITAGYGLFQASNNTAVMADVSADQRGVMSGVLSLSRNLGLVSGASLMGALFAFGVGSHDVAQATPGSVADGMRLTYAVATGLVLAAIAIARSLHPTAGRAVAQQCQMEEMP